MTPMNKNPATQIVSSLLLLATMLLSGCSTNVTVDGDYPSALTRKQPLHVGLVMDDQFSHYQFESTDDKQLPVTMALGESQVKLFSRVFTDMFISTTTYNSPPAKNPGLDLLIVPVVEEVQLATPFETKLNVYEVWIKYKLKVLDGNGQPIADWLMSSYGKTQSRFLKSDEEALNQATISALRDAGARLVLEFHRVPEVKRWLASRQADTQLSRSETP